MDGLPHSKPSVPPAEAAKTGIERRMVFHLLSYWRELSGGSGIPSLDDLQPEKIPDLWPNCCLVDLAGHAGDPVFKYIGENLAASISDDLVGRAVTVAPPDTLVGRAVANVPEVLRRGVPVARGGDFVQGDGRRVIFRSVMLPLSEDGQTLRFLLGAANCRIVTES